MQNSGGAMQEWSEGGEGGEAQARRPRLQTLPADRNQVRMNGCTSHKPQTTQLVP